MASDPHFTSAPFSDLCSMQSTIKHCSPISFNPRYLQQRVKELEQELENKRMELYESEQARAELEARFMGNSKTTTTVPNSMKQIEFGRVEGVAEWPRPKGESEDVENVPLLEKYERYIEVLYKGRSNDIDELVGYHQAEIKYLEAEHFEAMEQLSRNHKTDDQPQALGLEVAHHALQRELVTVQSAQKALQQELRVVKSTHQQELRAMKSACQQEVAAMKTAHKATQQELATVKSEQGKTSKGAPKTSGVPQPLIYAAKAKSIHSINQFCNHSRGVLVDIVEDNFKTDAVRKQASQATKAINKYMEHSRQVLAKILEDNFNKHTLSMNVDQALAGVVVRARKYLTSPSGSTDKVDI